MKFTMWSFGHILFMLSPMILTVLLYVLTKKNDYEKNRKIGFILSIVAVVILILRNIEIFFTRGMKIQPELIPFQICHFANFVLLYAFWKDSKSMFLIAFAFNLPAAFMSIVFANSLTNYETILTLRGMAYIFGHMLIVGLAAWAFLVGFVKVTKRDLIKGALTLTLLFFLSVPINNLFNYLMPNYSSNYFYSLLPEDGTPLEIFFKLGREITFLKMKFNIIYLLLSMLFGYLVYLLLAYAGSFYTKKFDAREEVLS